MTLLRARQLGPGDVRPFAPIAATLAVVAPEPDSAAAQLEEIALLREELADARKSAEAGARDARAAGLAEGKAAADKDEAARVAAITEAAQSVSTAWTEGLKRTDELATRIAHTALAKMFDDLPQATDVVLAALRRQIASLQRETIVAIQTSAADFPNAEALAALSEAVGAVVATDPALAAGGCVIKLKLGDLDIGLPTQWSALSSTLLAAADEEAR